MKRLETRASAGRARSRARNCRRKE